MAFFYKHTPRKFNYIPRYFDLEEQAWEEKKAAAGLDSKLTKEDKFRVQMRKSWSAPKDGDTKEELRAKTVKRFLVGAFVLVLFYLVFCTPVMQNIVSGLMRK